jgi:hypothetical protein
MSATQANMDNNVVDPGHQLEELIELIRPHLSHLVNHPPVTHRIIDAHGNETKGFVDDKPINKLYIVTSLGLAKFERMRMNLTKVPHLLGHHILSAITPEDRKAITERLLDLHTRQVVSFGDRG